MNSLRRFLVVWLFLIIPIPGFAADWPPGKVERVTALKFLQEQTVTRVADSNAALADFCHVLLNASELVYPD